MQIPILNGVYSDANGEFRTSYPVNYVPVPKTQGVSQGYLKPAEGIVEFCSTSGIDRGGFAWNGILYRVIGSNFVRIDPVGNVTVLGNVDNDWQMATFDNSFDKLAITSAGHLFYWDGSSLTRVTDGDLGIANCVIWIDGYFATTDGEFIVVTELNDPAAVDPLKYGSSEADPDPVMRLLKLRNELYAVNRFTTETFEDIGGTGFPFQRIEGAVIRRGAVGRFAACVLDEQIAFLGGGKNEPVSVWVGLNGQSEKIATREIDQILQGYTDDRLAAAFVEPRIDKGHKWLYVHLDDRTLVYDLNATAVLGEHVWFVLSSGINEPARYRARAFVWCYGKWISGDPTTPRVGYSDDSISTHYGDTVGWSFGVPILYNESRGAIVHQLELVALPGRVALGDDPVIWTSFSLDGETWSIERPISAGKQGQRTKRLVWFKQGAFRNMRMQRFRGLSDSHVSVARLEATIEALNA